MKRYFTKTLTLLLMLTVLCSVIFAMSLTANADNSDYVTINGISIKDGQYLRENDSATITTVPASGSDYAYYKSGILTLNNFDITGKNDFAVIYTSNEKLTIILNGTNSINTPYGYAFRTNYDTILTFMGSGSLTVNCGGNYAFACGHLGIGGGTLTVNAGGYAIKTSDYSQYAGTVTLTSSKDYPALWVDGPADIEGGTLTVEASDCNNFAADVAEDLTVSGGTVNIKPKTDMAGVAVGGTYTQTGGKVNLATKGYAGIVTAGTGKVTLTGGELKATGNGIGLQTANASVEIGRCDVKMEGVSTGIDCAGTVTFNGSGITKITATKNGISCKAFKLTKTEEFLVSGQSGLAIKTDSLSVSSTYATSISTSYDGKNSIPLSTTIPANIKYFYVREPAVYIGGIPMSYGEYLPQNGKAASTYPLNNNCVSTSSNGEALELTFKNFTMAATGENNAIKADQTILITGSGTVTLTSEAKTAIVLSSGQLRIDHSGTVNIQGGVNGITLQKGGYIQLKGTVNIRGGALGILAAQGDVTVKGGSLWVRCTSIGVTCQNLVVDGGKADIAGNGTTQALYCTGKLSGTLAANAMAATTYNGELIKYNAANLSSYKMIYVGEHICRGGTATCQTRAKCSECGKYYGDFGSHNFSTKWDYTSPQGHAHQCLTDGCSAFSTIKAHTPGAAATETSDQVCTTCNYVITPKLGHTHKTTKVAAVDPTCEKDGNIAYYTCSGCSKIFQDAAATKEFDSLISTRSPKLGHDFAEATCIAPRTCKRAGCGVTEGEVSEHNYGTQWFMDETSHWHDCTVCGHDSNEENHKPGPAATETEDQVCTTCGYVIEKAISHTHSFSAGWIWDESKHWIVCGCGERAEENDHEDTDGDGLCDSCAYMMTKPTEPTAPSAPANTPDVNNGNDGDSGSLLWLVILLAVVAAGAIAVVVVLVVKKKGSE